MGKPPHKDTPSWSVTCSLVALGDVDVVSTWTALGEGVANGAHGSGCVPPQLAIEALVPSMATNMPWQIAVDTIAVRVDEVFVRLILFGNEIALVFTPVGNVAIEVVPAIDTTIKNAKVSEVANGIGVGMKASISL